MRPSSQLQLCYLFVNELNHILYPQVTQDTQQYKTNQCKSCPVRDLCTTSKVNGKVLQRSEFQKYIEENAQQVLKNPKAYKKRQAIVEHPYGTIKRQWGFSYISTKKTTQRASADVGFMFIAYNLKRIWNILKTKKQTLFRAINIRMLPVLVFLGVPALYSSLYQKKQIAI
ncbi:transposase [Algibacter sp. 2305UL17-15]|uniref:transposase n=1 Tax=Algibacter sp. 2305UL17-15 TaxID=3231268 RepID=UPI00345992AA